MTLGSETMVKYYRFWRGSPKSEISAKEFKNGLNQIFLPKTAQLSGTPAKLISYAPVLLPKQLLNSNQFFPSEVALIGYPSKDDYLSFRKTSEGREYSDLHWEYFDRSQSSSLVPEAYCGSVEFKHAYDVMDTDVNWSHGSGFFRVFGCKQETSMECFLSRIKKHIDRLKSQSPEALVVLVVQDYILEYSLWKNPPSEYVKRLGDDDVFTIFMNVPLIQDRLIEYGKGLQYPL